MIQVLSVVDRKVACMKKSNQGSFTEKNRWVCRDEQTNLILNTNKTELFFWETILNVVLTTQKSCRYQIGIEINKNLSFDEQLNKT